MESEQITLTTKSDNDSFTVRMKRQFPWWILLFLLLLLLLPMERQLMLKFVEGDSDMPVALTPATMKYQDISTLGSHTDTTIACTTSDQGMADTITVHEPLWHWLFAGSGDSVYVSINSGCAALQDSAICYNDFPKDEPMVLKLGTLYKDVVLKIVDQENREPLPDTQVDVELIHTNGTSNQMSLVSDVAGQIEIPHCAVCDKIHLKASKEYYENREDTINAITAVVGDELELKPLKESIIVFVKDKRTRQPIPGATVTLDILNGNSQNQQELTSNVNGVILAKFDNLRLTWRIKLKGSKAGYKDGYIDEYTVEAFAQLDEEGRTIYLEPIAQTITFINTDGANRLPGVKNVITVDGQQRQNPEYSNSNGEFTVTNVFGSSVISIVASKPGYTTNSTKVKNKQLADLNTQDSRTIPLTKNETPLKISVHYPCTACRWKTEIIDPCNNRLSASNLAGCSNNRPSAFTDDNQNDGICVWPKATAGNYTVIVTYVLDNKHDNEVKFTITDNKGTRTKTVKSIMPHTEGDQIKCTFTVQP